MDFGIKVAGAYGELGTGADGKLNYQAGNLDLSQLTVIGTTYGEFDLEKYAAMNPELLVDLSFDNKTLWYVPEKSLAQVEKISPTLGVEMLDLHLLEIAQEFSKLAGALGADQNAATVTDAKTAFEASVQKVKDAVAANPEHQGSRHQSHRGHGMDREREAASRLRLPRDPRRELRSGRR